MWNCHEAVLNQTPRTNNDVEGWHRGFSSKLNVSHASLWKFFNPLQLEQSPTENKYSDMTAGKSDNNRKRKYVDYDERLLDVVSNFNDDDTDELEYLQGVALNISLFSINNKG